MNDPDFLNENQLLELERIIGNIHKKLFKNNRFYAFNIIKKNKKNIKEFYKLTDFNRNDVKLTELEVDDLIRKKLINYLSKKDGLLTLTFKCMVISDYRIKNPNGPLDSLLNDLNKIFFEDIILMSEEPLESREKAVIITFLGLGIVSDKYSLVVNDENQEYFKNAVDCTVNFLKFLGREYDDGSLDKLWKRGVIGENEIRAEVRRLNSIVPRTEGVYAISGRRHYLNILNDRNNLEEKKLEYLFARVFDKGPITFEEKMELIKTLEKIQNYEFKIFRDSPPFDMLNIRKGIKHTIESKI